MNTATTSGTQAAPYKLASMGLFLIAATASFALSVSLWFSGNEEQGIFVGLWVPSILSLGTLVRTMGDRR